MMSKITNDGLNPYDIFVAMNAHWLCAVGPQDQYDTQHNAAQDEATVDGKTVCLFYQGEILYCIIFSQNYIHH